MKLLDVYTSSMGRKLAQLKQDGGEDVFYGCTSPLIAPFGPSNFDKNGTVAQRLSLDIRIDNDLMVTYFKGLDAWAVPYLTEHSQRIFGRQMSLEQVSAIYRPCLRQKEGYDPLLHTKVTMDGEKATLFWDTKRQERAPPTYWRNARALYKLNIAFLWLSGGLCGFTINVVDCQVVSEQPDGRECPFGNWD